MDAQAIVVENGQTRRPEFNTDENNQITGQEAHWNIQRDLLGRPVYIRCFVESDGTGSVPESWVIEERYDEDDKPYPVLVKVGA